MKNKNLEKDLEELFKLFSEVESTAWIAGMMYPKPDEKEKSEIARKKFIKKFVEIKGKY